MGVTRPETNMSCFAMGVVKVKDGEDTQGTKAAILPPGAPGAPGRREAASAIVYHWGRGGEGRKRSTTRKESEDGG